MSTLWVVAEILREVAPRALKARQIADLAGFRLPTTSKTPETVVSRDLALAVRDHGASSRFIRVGRGEFLLKEALPTALYNVNDAYAVDWTRDLIAGEIVGGVVDDRPIRDLKIADVASYRQFHAFSGIGGWSRALRAAGWPDDVNVWTGSCPCFSRPSPDRSEAWSEWFRLISACRPAWIFGEQVSSSDGLAWFDVARSDLEGAGYDFRVLDAPAVCTSSPSLLYFVACSRARRTEILGASWLRERPIRQSKAPWVVDARDVACVRGRSVHEASLVEGEPGAVALVGAVLDGLAADVPSTAGAVVSGASEELVL